MSYTYICSIKEKTNSIYIGSQFEQLIFNYIFLYFNKSVQMFFSLFIDMFCLWLSLYSQLILVNLYFWGSVIYFKTWIFWWIFCIQSKFHPMYFSKFNIFQAEILDISCFQTCLKIWPKFLILVVILQYIFQS